MARKPTAKDEKLVKETGEMLDEIFKRFEGEGTERGHVSSCLMAHLVVDAAKHGIGLDVLVETVAAIHVGFSTDTPASEVSIGVVMGSVPPDKKEMN